MLVLAVWMTEGMGGWAGVIGVLTLIIEDTVANSVMLYSVKGKMLSKSGFGLTPDLSSEVTLRSF